MWPAVTAEDNDHLKVSDRSMPEWGELLQTLKLSTKRTGRTVGGDLMTSSKQKDFLFSKCTLCWWEFEKVFIRQILHWQTVWFEMSSLKMTFHIIWAYNKTPYPLIWIPNGSDLFVEKGKKPFNPDVGKTFLHYLWETDRTVFTFLLNQSKTCFWPK